MVVIGSTLAVLKLSLPRLSPQFGLEALGVCTALVFGKSDGPITELRHLDLVLAASLENPALFLEELDPLFLRVRHQTVPAIYRRQVGSVNGQQRRAAARIPGNRP
jgi:hypothetical protein